jgi:hypothetical protein
VPVRSWARGRGVPVCTEIDGDKYAYRYICLFDLVTGPPHTYFAIPIYFFTRRPAPERGVSVPTK